MPTDTVSQLIEALQSRAWWPFVGCAATLLLALFRHWSPSSWWTSIPTRWKPVPALLVVLVASVADAFAAGYGWQVATLMALIQTLEAGPTSIGMADMILRLSGAKQPSLTSLENDAREATSRARSVFTGLPPVVLVLLVGAVGCSWLRQNPQVIDGAMLAAENSDIVCAQFSKAKDRAECMRTAELVKLGAKLAEAALQREFEGQACPVMSAAPVPSGSAEGPAPDVQPAP